MPDGVQRHLAVQPLHALQALLAPAHGVADEPLELRLQRLDCALDALLLRFGQLRELVRAHHFTVLDRREGEPGRRAQQGDPLGDSFVAQCGKRLFVAFLEFGVDAVGLGAVLVALEYRGDVAAQLLHQPRHVRAQPGAAAGRQLDGDGAMRMDEVVDVDPVGRPRRALGPSLDLLAHQRVPAAARRAHDEQVVAVALDADCQFDRVGGTFLAGDDADVLEFIGGGKVELPGIATVREFFDRQGCRQAHADTLAAPVSRGGASVWIGSVNFELGGR